MSLDRRAVLANLGVTAALTVAAGHAIASAAGRASGRGAELARVSRELPFHVGPLVDKARVAEVMERQSLDGLILTHPITVYQFTGLDGPAIVRAFGGSGAMVVVTRNPQTPIALIVSSFVYYYLYANVHDASRVAVYQFADSRAAVDPQSRPSDAELSEGLDAGRYAEWLAFRDRKQEPLDDLERDRRDRTVAEALRHGVGEHRAKALGRAVADLGLTSGRIGVDVEPNTIEWDSIRRQVPKATLGDAALATTLVRVIKSPVEIELMRHAARNNADAALAACRAVTAGASYRDLRATFFSEAARRGNRSVWIVIDRMLTDAYDNSVRDGQAFLIDAVSTFAGYHGDYGRTVFVGEPSTHMRRHTRAIGHAWNAVRETLKPGLRFSDIQQIGQRALMKGGFDTAVRFTPHSVGLAHTDQGLLGDVVLAKGMVISVDCPVYESGVGGSGHLEDLTLITADGCETLNDPGDQIIVV